MQMQKYKYTNTQIHQMTRYQKDPTCGIFLKRGFFKDIKSDIHMSQTFKYKNTNTQIHYMARCRKDTTCGIFLKRGLFKDIRIHSCYRDAWKSTVFSVKNVSTDFSGNIHRKCTIFFPDLHLPNGMTTSPHPDHSTGPKPIQLVQVVFYH